jgi:hypothetical protein
LGTAKKIAQDLKSLHQNASAVSKSIQSAFNGVAAASSGASKALGALNNLQDALQVLDASQNPKGNLGLPGSINTLA